MQKMDNTHPDVKWLIQLLSQNDFINIGDGLGTFLHKTTNGWKICGRDDVTVLLSNRTFDDLSFALVIAKALKNTFLAKENTTNEQS